MTDDWERLGQKIARLYFINRLDGFSTAMHLLDGKIHDGESLTKVNIQRFRNALADLHSFVEKDMTAVAEGDIELYDTAILHVHNQAPVGSVTSLRDRE